jgi:Radical SAM superfamily
MGLLDPIGCGMWSLTPYDKCEFRCLYCVTRVQGPSKLSMPESDLLPDLRRRLDGVPAEELVIIGAFSDGYPPVEERLGITRLVVEELIRRERQFVIVTKGRTVLRDMDLLSSVRERCKVQISISSVDDGVLRHLDPGAPSGSERFAMLRTLRQAGIEVNLNALPWIPGVSETAKLIARTPPDVDIIFSPLCMGPGRDSLTLLGRRYTRAHVNRRYMAEYARYGHIPNTSWVKPSPPPTENDPMFRLPVRRKPTMLRRGLGAVARALGVRAAG